MQERQEPYGFLENNKAESVAYRKLSELAQSKSHQEREVI